MQFLESEICQITEWVWSAILERELETNAPVNLSVAPEQIWRSAVQIHGSWDGTVALECSETLARQLAAKMFDVPEHAATSADTQDALGELTNIVGGNIKSLMPVPSQLSLPQVTRGTTSPAAWLEGTVVSQVAFADQGEPFRIVLLKHGAVGAQ